MTGLYVLAKFLAYTFWCQRGLQIFQPGRRATSEAAAAWGAVRMLMGLVFGVLIWIVASGIFQALSQVPGTSAITYVIVYVPVRWLEWSLMAGMMSPGGISARSFGWGTDAAGRFWRLGGIVISCLADVPMIIALGGILPVGRFMC
jgi:hypothetical protein